MIEHDEQQVDQETSVCIACENCNKAEIQENSIKQIESDHCTDIRNHISPGMKVIEL